MLTVGCGGPWFAEVPAEAWPEDKDVRESIEKDFQGSWGDRRQEIVLIGEGIDVNLISGLLDECLLDDDDMKKWEGVMRDERLSREEKTEKLGKMWEDGWEAWPEFGIEEADEDKHEHGHDKADRRPKRVISEYLGNGHSHRHHGHR